MMSVKTGKTVTGMMASLFDLSLNQTAQVRLASIPRDGPPLMERRPSRSLSKHHVIKKRINKAALVGSDLYIPCLMKDPIGWLKGDYILYMDSMSMYDSAIYGEGKKI